MANDLPGHVDDFSSQCGCVTAYLDDRGAHIFLECLINEESYHHGVIESGVLVKAFERKLFTAKIFQSPMNQFIKSSSVTMVSIPSKINAGFTT